VADPLHRNGPAPARSDNNGGLMFVERRLAGSDGGIEVIVVERWVNDFVAVIHQESRFDAARYAVPAVEEEDFHRAFVSWPFSGVIQHLNQLCGNGFLAGLTVRHS
jgi:hypothetical protein